MILSFLLGDFIDALHALLQVPLYHVLIELLLVVWIFRLIFSKQYDIERTELSQEEKEQLIEEWEPEPLVPEPDPEEKELPDNGPIVSGKIGKYVIINEKKCLNLSSLNFLGMIGDTGIEDVAIKSLRKYGVGACGPRGFYGTIDVHLELEEKLAKFMKVEEAILYSYGFSSIASAIPAYSKRGDVIFCDEAICFSIQKGIQASRSRARFFKHNDMEDLERLLIEQAEVDKKNPSKAKITRRFIIVEGIYMNTGDICPLPKLIELKWKYKVRIFMDETLSVGVLGEHGRGLTEYFGVPIDDIDMISASLENSFGSYGGFCCGKAYVIDHQRLSGLGYCFSASLPPMLAAGSIKALEYLETNPNMLKDLKRNCVLFHDVLLKHSTISSKDISSIITTRDNKNDNSSQNLANGNIPVDDESELSEDEDDSSGEDFSVETPIVADDDNSSSEKIIRLYKILGLPESPIKHLQLPESYENEKMKEHQFKLQKIVDNCLSEGLALTLARYLEEDELFLPQPSIRISISSTLTEDEIFASAQTVREAFLGDHTH